MAANYRAYRVSWTVEGVLRVEIAGDRLYKFFWARIKTYLEDGLWYSLPNSFQLSHFNILYVVILFHCFSNTETRLHVAHGSRDFHLGSAVFYYNVYIINIKHAYKRYSSIFSCLAWKWRDHTASSIHCCRFLCNCTQHSISRYRPTRCWMNVVSSYGLHLFSFAFFLLFILSELQWKRNTCRFPTYIISTTAEKIT